MRSAPAITTATVGTGTIGSGTTSICRANRSQRKRPRPARETADSGLTCRYGADSITRMVQAPYLTRHHRA